MMIPQTTPNSVTRLAVWLAKTAPDRSTEWKYSVGDRVHGAKAHERPFQFAPRPAKGNKAA